MHIKSWPDNGAMNAIVFTDRVLAILSRIKAQVFCTVCFVWQIHQIDIVVVFVV